MIPLYMIVAFILLAGSILSLMAIGFWLANRLEEAQLKLNKARDWVVIFMVDNDDGVITLTAKGKELLAIIEGESEEHKEVSF
jgi:hypothetical protein